MGCWWNGKLSEAIAVTVIATGFNIGAGRMILVNNGVDKKNYSYVRRPVNVAEAMLPCPIQKCTHIGNGWRKKKEVKEIKACTKNYGVLFDEADFDLIPTYKLQQEISTFLRRVASA